MKWIKLLLDNAWAVVVIAGVLMQLIQAITKKRGVGEESTAGEPAKEYEFEDPELAARTRKIREEIQRKIAQRQRGAVESEDADAVEPPPIIREVVVASTEPVPAALRSSSRMDAQRQAEILEQQAALMERLQEAKLMKTAAAKRVEFEATTADHTAERRTATRTGVLGDLRSPEALRRAFILREVLGPPVALRR